MKCNTLYTFYRNFFYSKISSEIFKQNRSQIEYIIQQFMNLLYENLSDLGKNNYHIKKKLKCRCIRATNWKYQSFSYLSLFFIDSFLD